MKIKYRPADFRVEELLATSPQRTGRFTLYQLKKNGLGTIEALQLVRRAWNLPGDVVSYGGLKDRHAETVQYLTIRDGPWREFRSERVQLEAIGRLPVPYNTSHFSGNRFTLVLRDLSATELSQSLEALAEIASDGLPNYFDDQRFGSVGESGELVGAEWLRGHHERALWLAIADPTKDDRSATRSIKQTLRDHWGRWPECKAELPKSHERSLVTYLVDHPEDYRGAYQRLYRELRSLHFSAFQSLVWNQILGRLITQITRPEQRFEFHFKTGSLPIPRRLEADQRDRLRTLKIPLPTCRNPFPEGEVGQVCQAVLDQLDLKWEALRVKHIKDVFFSKGERPALFFPREVGADASDDPFHPGRSCLTLHFILDRGCYATMVVKRVTGDPVP